MQHIRQVLRSEWKKIKPNFFFSEADWLPSNLLLTSETAWSFGDRITPGVGWRAGIHSCPVRGTWLLTLELPDLLDYCVRYIIIDLHKHTLKKSFKRQNNQQTWIDIVIVSRSLWRDRLVTGRAFLDNSVSLFVVYGCFPFLFYIGDPQSVLPVVYRPSNDRPRQVALGTQLLRAGLCFTGPESPTPNNPQRTCSCRGDALCWSIKLKAVDLHVLQWKLALSHFRKHAI